MSTQTLTRIVISWEPDQDMEIEDWDCCLGLRKARGGEYAHEFDKKETIRLLVEVGGCDKEQAIQQAADMKRRFEAWQRGAWNFEGCIAEAFAVCSCCNQETRIADASCWGFDYASSDDYKQEEEWRCETEGDLLSEVLHELEGQGIEVSDYTGPYALEIAKIIAVRGK
jgi:hypothetical protein